MCGIEYNMAAGRPNPTGALPYGRYYTTLILHSIVLYYYTTTTILAASKLTTSTIIQNITLTSASES